MSNNKEDLDKLVINGVEHEISDEVSMCFRIMQEDLLHTKKKYLMFSRLNKIMFVVILALVSFIVFIFKFYV